MYSYDKCNCTHKHCTLIIFQNILNLGPIKVDIRLPNYCIEILQYPLASVLLSPRSAAKEKANFLLPRKLGCLRASLTPTHLYISTTHPRAMGFHGSAH